MECNAPLEMTCSHFTTSLDCSGQPMCVWAALDTIPPSSFSCMKKCLVAEAACTNVQAEANRMAMSGIGVVFAVWSLVSYLVCVLAVDEAVPQQGDVLIAVQTTRWVDRGWVVGG